MRVRFLVLAGLVCAGLVRGPLSSVSAARNCPEVRFVFARGSGGELGKDQNYLAWRAGIEGKLDGMGLSYEFIDLDYPAVGIDNLSVITGAFFGAGEAYEFGASVNDGVEKLITMINHDKCTKTKYVLGGYSQGAMVVSKALRDLDAEKIIYAATFGDPKIYLPEGKSWFAVGFGSNSGKNFARTGTVPAACRNENLSDYRMYVPDCYAYEGLLGSYQPYEPMSFQGKVGTWCNKYDVFCSSYLSVASHVGYVADNLYEDAGRVVADKVADALGVELAYVSPHDTAILIDTTYSMRGMIDAYKSEALRLARETLENGGRVALYDYRDLVVGYQPHQYCGFETCTLEVVERALNTMTVDTRGNGDDPESLLSAAYTVMSEQEWQVGATKSLVVLTDATYLSPDRDLTTYSEVVRLSREIDPVNFYVVTDEATAGAYEDLTADTGGRVAILGEDEIRLTDYIMERYDSLPRVVATDSDEVDELPWVEAETVEDDGESVRVRVRLGGGGTRVMVALNDAVLGITEGGTVVASGLDRSLVNELKLVALSETRRGMSAIVTLGTLDGVSDVVIPLAPDTGRA
ncbi:cutinase family protein [Candidatus Saccharibacteria bacterium]|nr:cutinase family protein [Candidatus Saccharibacteria bacterium]